MRVQALTIFTERRHTTLEDIKAQLEYREDNKAVLEEFNSTRILDKRTKLMLDEDAGKFIVSSEKNYKEANPDGDRTGSDNGCTS